VGRSRPRDRLGSHSRTGHERAQLGAGTQADGSGAIQANGRSTVEADGRSAIEADGSSAVQADGGTCTDGDVELVGGCEAVGARAPSLIAQ
jgi:hypothetical protein